jgi:hypothetical protein
VAPSCDCSPVGDAHQRVSAPSSSGPMVTPLAVTHAHNPRVVADEQQCGRVTFPESDGVGSSDG